MKLTKVLVPVFMCVATAGAHAQDVYLKAGLGYAFAMPGQKLDQYGNVLNGTVTNNSNSEAFDVKNASFSSGLHGIIGAGILFSKNIGAELDADINIAPRSYTEQMDNLTSNGVTYNYTARRKDKNTIILEPALVLQANPAHWQPYMRMGLALPVKSGITLDETYTYPSTSQVHQYGWNITNYFSLGFTAATGIKVKVSEAISIFAEASMLYLSISRKERDLESASFNGVSYPVSQLSGVKTIHYSKNGVADHMGNDVAFSQPYSNISFSAGVCYSLHSGGKKSRKK